MPVQLIGNKVVLMGARVANDASCCCAEGQPDCCTCFVATPFYNDPDEGGDGLYYKTKINPQFCDPNDCGASCFEDGPVPLTSRYAVLTTTWKGCTVPNPVLGDCITSGTVIQETRSSGDLKDDPDNPGHVLEPLECGDTVVTCLGGIITYDGELPTSLCHDWPSQGCESDGDNPYFMTQFIQTVSEEVPPKNFTSPSSITFNINVAGSADCSTCHMEFNLSASRTLTQSNKADLYDPETEDANEGEFKRWCGGLSPNGRGYASRFYKSGFGDTDGFKDTVSPDCSGTCGARSPEDSFLGLKYAGTDSQPCGTEMTVVSYGHLVCDDGGTPLAFNLPGAPSHVFPFEVGTYTFEDHVIDSTGCDLDYIITITATVT